MARNSVFEPKIKSTRVPIHLISPVFLSLPINVSLDSVTAFQVVLISNKLTKKSLVKVSGF